MTKDVGALGPRMRPEGAIRARRAVRRHRDASRELFADLIGRRPRPHGEARAVKVPAMATALARRDRAVSRSAVRATSSASRSRICPRRRARPHYRGRTGTSFGRKKHSANGARHMRRSALGHPACLHTRPSRDGADRKHCKPKAEKKKKKKGPPVAWLLWAPRGLHFCVHVDTN